MGSDASAKSLMKAELKQAPKKTMALKALRKSVVAALVAAGKSKSKAESSFESKLALPIFQKEGDTVRLVKATAEEPVRQSPRLAAQAAAAPPPELTLDDKAPKRKADDVPPKKSKKAKADAAATVADGATARPVTMMGAAEAKAWWADNRMTIEGPGSSEFRPIANFADAGFNDAVLSCTTAFAKPTAIQAQCWPVIMSGRDVIGVAETGSGKTLAFFLPAMMHCAAQGGGGGRAGGVRVLVLAPTRELAMQSEAVCKDAGAKMGLSSICIYGGVPKPPQKAAIRDGAAVVVATPGRLLDLSVNDGACPLGGVTYLVLDEADRMLDMGFEKDVRSIIGMTAPQRRTVMFTATWPESVRQIASEFLREPIRVNVGSEALTANHRVAQTVEVVDQSEKETKLPQLLKKFHDGKNRVLVFALYKNEAARVEATLNRKGFKAIGIHGDMTQAARSQALASFKDGSCPLLVATDVAARGLDIPDVEVVINYTFPLTIEDYIHRIGRTGRGGKTGISHTLFTSFDKAHAGALQNVLREASQAVPDALMRFGSAVKKKEHKMYGAHAGSGGPMKAATKIVFD